MTAETNSDLVPVVLRAATRIAHSLVAYTITRTPSDSLASRVAILAVSMTKAELARQGCGRVTGAETNSPLQHTVSRALTLACAQLSTSNRFGTPAECRKFFALTWAKMGAGRPTATRERRRSPPTAAPPRTADEPPTAATPL